jgi:hypothetical protein
MASHQRPPDVDRPTGHIQLVEINLIGEPDAPGGPEASSRVGPVQACVIAVLVAALLAIVLTTVVGGRDHNLAAKPAPAKPTPAQPSSAEPTPPEPAPARTFHVSRAAAHEPGSAGVAAAYGYPLRCLTVTIASADRSYARADYNRVSACGRYDGTATAIFRRVDGEWRPVLDATGYSCPIASLSRAVAAELAVCP